MPLLISLKKTEDEWNSSIPSLCFSKKTLVIIQERAEEKGHIRKWNSCSRTWIEWVHNNIFARNVLCVKTRFGKLVSFHWFWDLSMLSCSFLPPWNILGLPRFVGKRQYCFLSYYPGGSVNQPMLSPCPLWRAHCTQMTAFRIDSCHSLLLDTSHHLYLCPVFFFSCVLMCGPPTDCHPGSWAWETWEGFCSKPTLTLEFPFFNP